MATEIDKTAIIHPKARLGSDVTVGPYSVVSENAEIGDRTIIGPHVVIDGCISIGEENKISPFCVLGGPPQDMSYKGEPTKTIIGDRNTFREYVSIHRGTLKEKGLTTIGSDNLMMAYVHVGHDVDVGSHCVVANSTNFAGHVKVGDRVIIGGGCNISQFVTLGRGSYIGGASALDRDVPLFCTAYGNRIRLKGINIIGMRRQGYSKQVITEVVDFYRDMEASPLSPRAFIDHDELMLEYKENEIIKEMCSSIHKSEVGIAPFFMS